MQRALQWDGIDPDVLHALGDARQAQFMQSPCSPWASSSHASGRSVSTSSSVRCKSGRPEAVHMTSRAGLLYGIAVENTPATESTAAKEDTCAPSPSVSDMSDPIQGSADAPPMKGSAEALHQHSVRKPKTITKRLRKAAGKAIAFVRPRNSGRDVPPRPISDRTPRSGAI